MGLKPEFVQDVQSFDMPGTMANCQIPLLAFSASKDSLVEEAAAHKILTYTQAEARHINIEGADHLFSDRQHTAELMQDLLEWVSR